MFTVCTRFQYLTFFSNPDSSHFLNRFFYWFVHMRGVTVFILVSTNEFVTVKVFFRMFTVCTRFQYLTFFSNPDSSHFLNRFFYWFVHMRGVTVFILVSTNEFVTVKVFFWFFTICTRFQYLTSHRYPDSGDFLNRFFYWFFYRFVDMSGDRPLNLGFHKLITREVIFRFEIRSNHW